jgi:hypothetical protein
VTGWRRVVVLPLVVAATACARTLPDQDRRITVTPAVAKLPAEDLWKEYRDGKDAADRKYWGKAIEVSGKVTGVASDATAPRAVKFAISGDAGIQAFLLDDEAAGTIKAAEVGRHFRLKCFCAGLATDVILRSCIQPR